MTQTIDLEKMKLVPLNKEEVKDINGGTPWLPILGIYVLLEAALNPSAHLRALKEGYNSVKFR